MALITSDRVLETSSNTGTISTFNLAGPPTGFNGFVDKIGASNTCYYAIINTTTNINEWEIGIGTVGGTTGSGNGSIVRTTILTSSNTNSIVNFSAGTKQVFVTYPASKVMYSDASGGITINNVNSLAATNSCYPTTRPTLEIDFLNNETLDPRITFSRADASGGITGSATYYDSKTSVVSDQNLLRWSNDITNNVWVSLGNPNTPPLRYTAQTAPDGTNTANYLFLQTSAIDTFASVVQQNSIISEPNWIDGNSYNYTASVWLKTDGSVSGNVVLIFGGVNQTTNITNVWTKYSVNIGGPSYDLTFGFQKIHTDISQFYFWAPQIEQGATASLPYTPTYADPITIIMPVLMTASANTPRFDHDPLTRKPQGLLIEDQSANLLNFSSTGSWATFSGATVTNNVYISPFGTLTAMKVSGANGSVVWSGTNMIDMTPAVAQNTDYTFSVFLKGLCPSVKIVLRDQALGTTVELICQISLQWKRFSLSTTTTSATSMGIMIGGANTDFAMWGWQLETGLFATSYIHTTGTSLIRNNDNVKITGKNFLSWYNQYEGSLYSEFLLPYYNSNGGTLYDINLSSGPLVSKITLQAMSAGFKNGYYFIVNSGGTIISLTTGDALTLQNTVNRAVAVYKDNSSDLNYVALNSNIINASSSVRQIIIPKTVDQIQIGASGLDPTTAVLNGYLRKLYYYPKAFSRDAAIGLTR